MKALTIIGLIILILALVAAIVFISMILSAISAIRCENCSQKELCNKRIEEGRVSICEEEIFNQQNTSFL